MKNASRHRAIFGFLALFVMPAFLGVGCGNQSTSTSYPPVDTSNNVPRANESMTNQGYVTNGSTEASTNLSPKP